MGGMTFSMKPDLQRMHLAPAALCQSGGLHDPTCTPVSSAAKGRTLHVL